MKRLPFIIWTLGFPVAMSLSDYLDVLAGHLRAVDYAADVQSATALATGAIWCFVAAALWRDRS